MDAENLLFNSVCGDAVFFSIVHIRNMREKPEKSEQGGVVATNENKLM